MEGRTLQVEVEAPDLLARGRGLADELGARLIEAEPGGGDPPWSGQVQSPEGEEPVTLTVRRDGLSLRLGTGPEVMARTEALTPPRSHGPDQLWKAVLAGEEPVVDATAGLGGDGFHLAARGATVTLIERSAVVAALLRDALQRARGGELGAEVRETATRIDMLVGDARDLLRSGRIALDRCRVVYLDPMFEGSHKRSLPPKGMALFRALLGQEDAGTADLLAAARESATRRVVVKRQLKAPHVGGIRPSGEIRARTLRFDLYPPI